VKHKARFIELNNEMGMLTFQGVVPVQQPPRHPQMEDNGPLVQFENQVFAAPFQGQDFSSGKFAFKGAGIRFFQYPGQAEMNGANRFPHDIVM
jgi:hypothetical protein